MNCSISVETTEVPVVSTISGEVIVEPVVSKKSGLIFEKRLIEQYISENGKCPVTGAQLTTDDLAPARICKLGHLLAQGDRQALLPEKRETDRDAKRQCEIDELAVEDEELDRDAKRQHKFADDFIAELETCNASLSQLRKKREMPSTLTPVDALKSYRQYACDLLYEESEPGITSIDIDTSKNIIATGGADRNVVLYDLPLGDTLSPLSGHSKKVTSVKFVAENNVLLSGSADKTVCIWQRSEDGKYTCRHTLKHHTAEVQAVTVHATNKYFVTASLDRTWCFYDLSSGKCLTQVADPSDSKGYTSAAFHPDGLLLGTGSADGIVRIWDVRSQDGFDILDNHSGAGAITALSFAANGYFLATAACDGVRMWDMRKVKNFRRFETYGTMPTVDFDDSGSYLAIAGQDVRIYQVGKANSEWTFINDLPVYSGQASVKFGPDARYLAVGSMNQLHIFGIRDYF